MAEHGCHVADGTVPRVREINHNEPSAGLQDANHVGQAGLLHVWRQMVKHE